MTSRSAGSRTAWATGTIVGVSLFVAAALPFREIIVGDPDIPSRIPAVFPATWRYHAGAHATFEPHAMVASDSRIASEVGVQVMKQGGNAVDAAVATGFALAVAYPEAGNIGGGGKMGIHMADGATGAPHYRQTPPPP